MGAKLLLALTLTIGAALSAESWPPAARAGGEVSSADLAVALRKVNTLGSVLYIAAHPDDENTSLLAYLARERCVRAAYLSVTRGDGGQNLIGSEKGALIGLLRTQELLAARRIDGAEQFFTRAIDFGYSKNPEETLKIWGKDDVLGDMVWVIRNFRPDVIITRFPTNGDGGHGHHTASAILAAEAFKAAADPNKYPEQLKYTKTWQATRICWNAFMPGRGGASDAPAPLAVDIGGFNPILGKSYTEIAGASRSQHKSQGFGAPERRGTRMDNLQIVGGEPAKSDFLENVNLTWSRVPGAENVAKLLAQAELEFDPRVPSKIVPILLKAHGELANIADPWAAVKRRELLEIIRGASGIWLEATAAAAGAAPGETVKIATTVIARSDLSFQLGPPEITFLSGIESKLVTLKRNELERTEINVKIPSDAELTEPYWLQSAAGKGLFAVKNMQQIGSPESEPAMRAKLNIHAGGQVLEYTVPVIYKWVDPVKGELSRPFVIAPPLTAEWDSKVYVFSGAGAKKVNFKLKAGAAKIAGALRPSPPKGWTCDPAEFTFNFDKKDDEASGSFNITPGEGAASGELRCLVEYKDGASAPARSVTRVDYPHIPIQTLFPPMEAALVRADVNIVGKNIGYIEGAGDEVAPALEQIGYKIQMLTDAELESGDLTKFDAIVAGVRAYNTRPRLRFAQKRLLQYVEAGGTYVVQYNTTQELVTNEIGPFPLTIGRDRVTVEEAPVKFIKNDHPLLTSPNKIRDADFDGWVQERGLYFARIANEKETGGARFGPPPAGSTDSRYESVFDMSDPGEPSKLGSLLFARHGKGVFIYTGLSFFRELPAGVAGAYRLFANLVSARGEK